MNRRPEIKVGEFTVTSVSDGILNSSHDVILIDRAESARLTDIPYGQPVPLDVNVFLIRNGDRLMLSDAGSGLTMQPTLGMLPANLRAMGIEPEKIDTILLTHLHPDHSLGLVDEADRAVFPNAELIVHEIEAAFWLDRDPQSEPVPRLRGHIEAQQRVTAPYAGRIRRIKDGEVIPGITAMLRPGHTPGHTNFLIESDGQRLLIWGDIVHLAAIQLPRPDATLVFDVQPELAKATRETVFGWVAAEGLTVAGAHLPGPGFGRIERRGQGFEYCNV